MHESCLFILFGFASFLLLLGFLWLLHINWSFVNKRNLFLVFLKGLYTLCRYLVGDSWHSKETFSRLQCSQFNCSIVNERYILLCLNYYAWIHMSNIFLNFRSYFHNFSSFDAVVFHERGLQNSDLPNQRSPEQLFVHFNLEAPFHSSIHGL